MSITSRINEMSSHIEQAYDELQGLGADLTNVNKNIENISMVLDDIYDSMPQVSGEGTSLTLDDTRVGKIKSTLKGNTSQSGTPTPTSPIPINVVSGDNEINVVGKNFINFNNLSDVTLKNVTTTYLGSKFKMNGTTDGAGNTIAIGNNLGITIPAGTYTYTFKVESGTNTGVGSGKDVAFYLCKSNTSSSSDRLATITVGQLNTYNNEKSVTFTTSSAIPLYIYAYANNSGMAFNDYVIQVQLEKGEQFTNYEPYQGNTYNIDLPVENLFDNSVERKSAYPITNVGSVVTYNNSSATYSYVNCAYLIGGETYTLSWTQSSTPASTNQRVGVIVDNDNKILQSINSWDNGVTKKTITPTNSGYLVLATDINATNIQLEKGSKQHNFTPYGTTPIELCKIGNYQDYFGKSDGRNLFDKDKNIVEGYTFGNDDILISATDFFYQAYYIPVEPNTTYSFIGQKTLGSDSLRVCEYTSDKTFIQRNYELYTITTTQNTHYIRVSNYKDKLNTTQVEKGSSATPYQPYGVGKWYLHKEIGKVVLNGSENWGKSSKTQVNRYFVANIFVTILNASSIDILSNYFVCITPNQSDSNNIGLAKYNEQGLMVNFSLTDTDFDTLEKFKTWLSSNNVVVYYVLATPVNTALEDM